MPEVQGHKTRSYNVAITYSCKFMLAAGEFAAINKQIAEGLDKLIATEAKRPLTVTEKQQKAKAERHLVMVDDELVVSFLRTAFKELVKETAKELKTEGFSKFSPAQLTITPRVS